MAEIDGINDRATGDGHRLGMAVGADVINMDVFRGAELRFVPSARGTFKDYFKTHLPALSVLSKITAKVLDTFPKGFVKRIATEVLVSW